MIMGMVPFKRSEGFGPQLIDLLAELEDFAFEHKARAQGAGEGKALLLDRKQALEGIEQEGLHAR